MTTNDKRAGLESIILTWSSEITGEPREKLAPDALTLIDRLILWHEQEIAEAKLDEAAEVHRLGITLLAADRTATLNRILTEIEKRHGKDNVLHVGGSHNRTSQIGGK